MKIITEYFLLAMLITLIYLYLMQPTPKIIVKYPNNDNSNSVCSKHLIN